MRKIMSNLADVLDILAFLGAGYAAYFFLTSIVRVTSGPEFMQVALLPLVIAIVPYCLAGTANRIWARMDPPNG